ncbi:hypothetical protein, partial [Kaistella sp.]|uniref:hypothetical protein n=1 Tax=Kaistella sp. TaxID=2782235 RepID=UPI003C5E895D
VKESAQNHSFHVILAGNLMKYSVFGMTILLYYYTVYKKNRTEKHLDAFFSMALFFLTFSNLASSVPSGGRFVILSNLMVVTAFVLFLNQRIKLNVILQTILGGSLLFIIIFKVRTGLDFVGLFLFIGNPIVNWFVEDSPIIDFVKSIF